MGIVTMLLAPVRARKVLLERERIASLVCIRVLPILHPPSRFLGVNICYVSGTPHLTSDAKAWWESVGLLHGLSI
jgi:hypothetical protein